MIAPQMQLADPPAVAHDRFPVTVDPPVDARTLTTVRAILTVPDGDRAGRLYVWLRPGEPVVDVEWEPERSVFGDARNDWGIVTPDGLYVLRHQRGCGCGNRLRGWIPWTPYRMGRLA